MSDIVNHALLFLIQYFFVRERGEFDTPHVTLEDLYPRRQYGRKSSETYGIFCNQFDAINFILCGRENA